MFFSHVASCYCFNHIRHMSLLNKKTQLISELILAKVYDDFDMKIEIEML